ncbi:hypothetical protein JCM3766R1_002618 [Sporobolomyces carnicolor]
MELLNESESRAFSSFLDSFASTSASPPPPPPPPLVASTASVSSYYPSSHVYTSDTNHSYPDQQRPNGASSYRTSDPSSRGGADYHATSRPPYAVSGDTRGMQYTGAYQNHMQYLPTPSSSSTSAFNSFQFAPAPPPPVIDHRRGLNHSHHHQQHQERDRDAAEIAKQRKLQHAEELQQWMTQAQARGDSHPQSQSHSYTHSRPSSLYSPSPPKRTKSSDVTATIKSAREQGADEGVEQDPIAAMLEAERKAGYAYGRTMNAAIARETLQAQAERRVSPPVAASIAPTVVEETSVPSFETFAPPPPPAAFRSTRRRPSTSNVLQDNFAVPPRGGSPDRTAWSPAQNDDDGDEMYEAPAPRAKRKAAPSAATSRSNSTSSRRTTQRTLARPASRLASEAQSSATPALDPESADATLSAISPTPFRTPSNIPLPLDPDESSFERRRRRQGRQRARAEAIAPPATLSTSASTKSTTLLSVEQKKANHIASEQKRRAAIRQAYDDLCAVVPVLRAAVQEFEERVRKLESEGGASTGGGNKKKKGKVEGNGKTGALMGGINVGGEKIDGRAGPKSEAVVLSKTVDRVRQLLLDRATLLENLSHAYDEARERGIEVPRARAHEWDEPWDGDSSDDDQDSGVGGVKREREEGEEDEEMWEDE